MFIVGIVFLLGLEILRVYFIMPFPGSQRASTVEFAYYLHKNIMSLRVIGLLLIAFPVFSILRSGKILPKLGVGIALGIFAVVFYFFNFRFLAEKIFYPPQRKIFADISTNQIPETNLVLGVSLNGKAKAYPIEFIGYHHQVRDSVGQTPVMVTYCTVCRTGRVFSPVVEDKLEDFRLVGMDHFNAMFEDVTTRSWWRQVSGEAIAGPLLGKRLAEIPSEQMRLAAWISRYPHTLVMQPDCTFAEEYEGLKNYDEGKSTSSLTRADSLSWQDKSWVVGVQLEGYARAYDWNELLAHRAINDSLAGTALLVAVADDSATFQVWRRDSLWFSLDSSTALLKDEQSQSLWNWQGECATGALQGSRLPVVQSYQEFWHSWRTFHPHTSRY